MKKSFFKYIATVVFLVVVITSCKVIQPYQAPEMIQADLYRDASGSDTNSIAQIKWNEFFVDTALQTLIGQGIENNIDLQMAFNRIQQAEAYYEQSIAAFLPSLDANASVNTSKLSEAQGFGIRNSATNYQIGVSSVWEADIWGKLKSSKKANLATLLQTDAAARAVQTGLVSNIANYYYLLLALDQQLLITQQTIKNWDTTVQTMRDLKDAARVTEAAVVQSEAQKYATQVTVPDLKQSIRETENALSILLGIAPGNIDRNGFANQQTIELMHTGVPMQLLANRPDVMQSEFMYRYYFEMTNVARTYFYPSVSITGSVGLNALKFEALFNPASFVASIGAGLTQPIFNRKANKTRLTVAKLQQQEAMLGFKNSLLNAGREVSDAINLYETALEKTNIRSNQMDALQKSVAYTEALLRNGFGSYVEIITARQSLLQAELGRVNDRLQQLQASVALYRSLGGGWR